MGQSFYSTNMFSAMPPQKVSMTSKTKAWREQCVEAVTSMGSTKLNNGRTSWGRKQINYDLVNSIFDSADFKYVLDPYGLGDNNVGNQPAKLRDINLIVNKINLLKGEEINRPFNFQVLATNGEAVSEKDKMKKEMLLYVAQAQLQKQLGINTELQPPSGAGQEVPQDFESVEKWAQFSYRDIREQWGNDILQYLKHKENLALRFNEGWEHALIAAEEIYYVGIVNGEPRLRVCNPLNCDFDRNPDNPNIEDGDWFKEERWMTTGQILDEYGEFLTDAQVKKLDQGLIRPGVTNQMFPGYAYSQEDMRKYESGGFSNRTRSSDSHHLVTHVVWKSMKKIGFLSYVDEQGESQMGIVDETFKMSPEMEELGYTLEWRWIPEVWHGTKIGDDFFGPIEPLPNQTRSMDNPSEVKLPYIGRIYNGTNSTQTSLVDLLKPHQYLYNIIWFRLEAELAKAKGKKMVMDMAQIPRSEGIDLDKWMYFFDNVGIAFINSFEEGKDKFQGQVSQFNQFQAIDVSLSQSVGQYIQILTKIEQLMDKVTGINPQREGATKASETAQGVERSVTQSSHITEPWFYIHNEIKKNVLTQLLETAKFAYPNKKKLHYIVDDVQRMSIELDMDKFADSDYGIFVTNSNREAMIFQKLETLAERAMASGAASLSDVITMYKANSVSELSGLIRKSELEKRELEQQQLKMQQQGIQMQIEAQAAEKDKDRAHESRENDLDRKAEIQKAVISSMGFDTDTADSGSIEVVEQGKLFLEQQKLQQDSSTKEKELRHEKEENEKDRQLKRQELKSKEKIEKTKLKNPVSGEKKKK